MKRREFLKTAAMAGLAAASFPRRLPAIDKPGFPVLEVSGSPHHMGLQIGKRFGPLIRSGLERRADWFKSLKDYAAGEGKAHYLGMLSAARKHTPQCVEELEGWSKGSGVPFDDLMVLNCKSELDSFMKAGCGCPGCSTVALKHKGRFIVVHNEDGDTAYDDLNFILRAKPTGGTRFVAMTYPGILSGMAPAVNEHGVLVTTNYIPSRKVRPGIPRYFQMRRLLEAKTVDEALKMARHADRAFAFHHIIASLAEGRVVSIEVNPDKWEQKEIDGLFLHTNHLVHRSLKDEPQFEKYMETSSYPRYRTLEKKLGTIQDLSGITRDVILDAVTEHEGRPTSVCRHPKGKVRGSTLATAVFEYPATRPWGMRLYRNQPCLGKDRVYSL